MTTSELSGLLNPPAYAKPRWPQQVYAVGEDPDPRFTFSNERTLLAWIRTGLALAAAGVALGTFVQEFPALLRTLLAACLLCAAAVSSVGGYLRWMRSERALRLRLPLPAPVMAAALAAALAGVGAVGLVAVIVRHQ